MRGVSTRAPGRVKPSSSDYRLPAPSSTAAQLPPLMQRPLRADNPTTASGTGPGKVEEGAAVRPEVVEMAEMTVQEVKRRTGYSPIGCVLCQRRGVLIEPDANSPSGKKVHDPCPTCVGKGRVWVDASGVQPLLNDEEVLALARARPVKLMVTIRESCPRTGA